MADLPRKVSKLAARQHGVITIQQLTKSGVSRHTIRRLERNGVLDAGYKSVRRLTSTARTLEQTCAELCLAHPRSYITGVTAGSLLGLRKMPKRSPIVLGSPHALHVQHKGVEVRRTTKIGPSDIVRRDDGISTASPTRLGFDLAARLREHAGLPESGVSARYVRAQTPDATQTPDSGWVCVGCFSGWGW